MSANSNPFFAFCSTRIIVFFSIYTFIGKDFTPAVINEVQKDSPAMIGGLKKNALKYKTNTIKEGWELIDYRQENRL